MLSTDLASKAQSVLGTFDIWPRRPLTPAQILQLIYNKS